MILKCVVARSIVCSMVLVSASPWVLNNSGRSLTPVFNNLNQLAIGETSCQHKPLAFLEDLWSRICQVYTDELCQCWFVCGVFNKLSVVWNPTPTTDDICRLVSLPVRRSHSSYLIDISQSYRSNTRVTDADVTPRLLVSSDWILCITISPRSLNVSNLYARWLSWDTASTCISSQLDFNLLAKSTLVVFHIVPSSLKREGGTGASS